MNAKKGHRGGSRGGSGRRGPKKGQTQSGDWDDASNARPPTKFCGLMNQGATCYLNSLIQTLYMTPELRHGLFRVDPKELGVDLIEEESFMGESEGKKEAEANETILEQLKGMGFGEFGAAKSLLATGNDNFEAAFEYYLAHSEDPGFLENPNKDKMLPKKKKPRLIPLELQRLFTELKKLNAKAVSTASLTTKGFKWQDMEGRVQHDAHELQKLLLDSIERSLKNTSGEKLISELFRGEIAYRVQCLRCNTVSERREKMYDLILLVEDQATLKDSLAQYFHDEMMDGDYKYTCDVCQGKQTARRTTCLTGIPPVLNINLMRFKCDPSTNFRRQKVLSRLAFPLTLDMGQYVSSSEPTEEDSHTRLAIAKGTNSVYIDTAVELALDIAVDIVSKDQSGVKRFEDLSDDMSVGILRRMGHLLQPESSKRGERIERDYVYELQAVLMHRGSAFSGHYFGYIRDSINEGRWESSLDGLMEGLSLADMEARSQASSSVWGHTVASSASIATVSPGRTINAQDAITSATISSSADQTGTSLNSRSVDEENATTFLLRSGDGFLVSEDSALGKIVYLLQSPHLVRSPMKGGGKPPEGLTVREITKGLQGTFGMSWSTLMRVHGPIASFLAESLCRGIFNVIDIPSSVNSSLGAIVAAGGAKSGLDNKRIALRPGVVVALVKGSVVQVAPPPPRANAENDGGGEWDMVGKKKAKRGGKGRSGSGDVDPALTIATPPPSPIKTGRRPTVNTENAYRVLDSEDDEVKARKAKLLASSDWPPEARMRRDQLASEILGKAVGNFYTFNDSDISPMHVAGLQRAFEGKDSAYILVYRHVKAAEAALARSFPDLPRASSGRNVGSSRRGQIVEPPSYWMEAVTTANARLAEERQLKEVERRSITLSVRWPWHVKATRECPVLWDCHPKESSPHASALPVSFLEASRDLEVRIDGQMGMHEVIVLLHEKALALLAKCHTDAALKTGDAGRLTSQQSSPERERAFLQQWLQDCVCLNAYQACEHDGSDTALTVFPSRTRSDAMSEQTLADAVDVLHSASKSDTSRGVLQAPHEPPSKPVAASPTTANLTPLEVLCWSGRNVGEEAFKAVTPDDIYLSRLILLRQKRGANEGDRGQYHVRESHDFYPQWNLKTGSDAEGTFGEALTRLSRQACLHMGMEFPSMVLHALLPSSGSRNQKDGEIDKNQAVLLFVDSAPAPGVQAMSPTERSSLMQKILTMRTFYIEEKGSAMASLQVCGSGAHVGSICELEMNKRDRRWYMEVRTDVALPNVETKLDCGLGIDTADEFRGFVAAAQKFPTEAPLPSNRSILGIGFKGISSPPCGNSEGGDSSTSGGRGNGHGSPLATLRPRSLRDLLEAKSSGALARALAAQGEAATEGDPFMQAFGGLSVNMEPTEPGTSNDRGGFDIAVPYQASGGFNPSFDTSYPAPGSRELATLWLEVDRNTSVAQLRRELLLRLRVPLLQHRLDKQIATGDHDGGDFASSEVHWSHPSRDRLGAALGRDVESDRAACGEIAVSKYKLSVRLPGAEGGVHVFSNEEEAEGAPLFHMGLLDKGLTMRLEEHPLLRPPAAAPSFSGSSQTAIANASQTSSVGQGIQGGLGTSSTPTSTTITLKVALADPIIESNLAQNSPDAPTEGSEKPRFLEVDVQPSDSLLSLKDKMGVLLMDFQAGWTLGSQERALIEFESQDESMSWPLTSAAAMALATPRIPPKKYSPEIESTPTPNLPETAVSPEVPPPVKSPSTYSWRLREGNFVCEKKRLLQEFSWPGVETRRDIKILQSRGDTSSSITSAGSCTPKWEDVNSCDSVHSCTKLQMTVAEAGLRDGSVVLFERGLAPVAGLLRYPLYMWDVTGSAEVTTSSPASGVSEEELSYFTALNVRRKYLQRLGFVLAHESMLSASLRRIVWAKCRRVAGLDGGVSATPTTDGSSDDVRQKLLQTLCPPNQDSFLVRELRPDLLPGRSVAHPPESKNNPLKTKPKASITDSLLGTIGSKGVLGGGGSKSTRGGGKAGKNSKKDSVLSLGIIDPEMGGALVVHTFPVQPIEGGISGGDKDKGTHDVFWKDPGTMRLWIHKVTSADISSSTALVPMRYPPTEIVLQVPGGKPSIKQLFDCLMQSIEQGQGQIRAFKWWQTRGEWAEISPDPSLENALEPRGRVDKEEDKGGWSLSFNAAPSTICQNQSDAERLIKQQAAMRTRNRKAPATMSPTLLQEGDLIAAFVDPALPVPPQIRAKVVDVHDVANEPIVRKTLQRPEDAYLVKLISSSELHKRTKKSSAILSSSEVTGAHTLASKKGRSRRDSDATPSMRQETALKLGDLDFSDEEEEKEKKQE